MNSSGVDFKEIKSSMYMVLLIGDVYVCGTSGFGATKKFYFSLKIVKENFGSFDWTDCVEVSLNSFFPKHAPLN